MKIEKHTVPSLTYTLRVDGEIIEVADVDQPLVYLHGANMMIPGFEKEMQGLEIGASFDFKVSADQGYGDIMPDAVVELPKTNFMIDGVFASEMIYVGATVPMQDQNGHPLRGTVAALTDVTVTMDFNHPLAGKELHFTGDVIDVRKADQHEIEHGHVHGPGGHHH
jgi:FKBP-type peptidyl-prolyl cis-trans isomerase SlyD